MYKLIAIDMDGTLLNDHHEVTTEVRGALDAAKAEGVNIVLLHGPADRRRASVFGRAELTGRRRLCDCL